LINQARMNKDAAQVLNRFHIRHKPETKITKLDFAERQMVEIAKVLDAATDGTDHALILLDEPTSVLNSDEIKELFDQISEIKKQGHTVVFISHRLNEVLQISDHIYVFKDGENTGCVPKEKADAELLYERMTGRATTDEYYKESRQTVPQDKVVMEAVNLSLYGYFRDISFKIRKGDILGICGLEGSGVEELCGVLSGDTKPTSGHLNIYESARGSLSSAKMTSPQDAAKKYGVLSIPKNRNSEGVIGTLSVGDNLIMSNLKGASRKGVITGKRLTTIAEHWINTLGIKTPGVKAHVMQLSGGNAQKVVFGRAMFSDSDIFILNHASRGVDVGAKEDIYSLIRDMTEQGASAILVGDTLDECIGMASRILVMKDGLVQREFDAPVGSKPAQADVVKYML